jgi:hypothetical protein
MSIRENYKQTENDQMRITCVANRKLRVLLYSQFRFLLLPLEKAGRSNDFVRFKEKILEFIGMPLNL